MAYTTIDKASEHFNTVLYTGNNSSPRTITGVGFQPDMNWSKIRSESNDHWVSDVVRGSNKIIRPNGTNDELVNGSSGYLSSFNSDGYVIAAGSGTNENFNKSSGTMASWNWKAGGAVSNNNNDDGQGYSTVSANTTAGFSIVTYTGTGSNTNFGHGLGAAPKMILVKNLSDTDNWVVYHESLGNTDGLYLNTTDSTVGTNTFWNNSTPTATVFYVGTHNRVNGSGDNMIAYCFAEKTGYSKFGSYNGNNNSDGTFVYTGFKPAFLMLKDSQSGQYWHMFDNKREPFNDNDFAQLAPNAAGSEATIRTDRGIANLDFLSNGFKFNTDNSGFNGTNKYIYMCFAAAPLVGSNNVTAKAR
jgi:hypothetical protein